MNPRAKFIAFRDRLKRDPIGAAFVSLASDSAVYLTGGLLIGLGNVILVPLYTRTLAPREFGVYALVDVTVLLVVTVSLLKMDVSYLKWFADLDPDRHGELLGSTLVTGLAVSTIAGATLSLGVAGRLGELWLPTVERSYAWLLCPIVILENLQALFLTDLRARRRPIRYSVCAVLRLAGLVVASYYLLVVRQMGLQGLFLGRLIGDAAAAVFLSAVCLRSVAWRFAPSLLGPMVRFGVPLVWSVFAVMLQDASGRYFLSRYGTLEQVGLLGAAIKVGAVFLVLFGQPFGVAWGGMLFQIVKQRDAQVIYSKIFGYVYVLALGIALILTIFAPTLFRVFTAPAYYPAIALLPLVLLVRAMNVIEQPAAAGIYISGQTKIFAAIYTVALALNLFLLYILVPKYGAIGVGWAWVVGSAAIPVLDLLFGQRLYRLSFSAKLTLFPLLLWIFAFFRPLRGFVGGLVNHLVIQFALGAVVVLGIGGLLIHDLRALRRQLRERGLGSPAWEVSSH